MGSQNHPVANPIFDLQGQIFKVKGQMGAKKISPKNVQNNVFYHLKALKNQKT